MPYFYAFSVLLSAFLLFQVQPLIGKYILPWFGGTPTVWSTVLLFFQALLTGGYAYAYGLLGRLHGRQQGLVHLALLGLSLGLLLLTALAWPSPITPDTSWRPGGSALPIWEIVKVLAVAVAIPYFLLSSNSTLTQAWFHRDYRRQTPYRLYALSNAGSLLALISYPFIFEPFLSVRAQGYLWSAGYVVFAIGAAYLALRTSRRSPADDAQEGDDPHAGRSPADRPGPPTPQSPRPAQRRASRERPAAPPASEAAGHSRDRASLPGADARPGLGIHALFDPERSSDLLRGRG